MCFCATVSAWLNFIVLPAPEAKAAHCPER